MMEDSVIKVSHLTKSYNDKVVLDDLSFEFERGKIIGVVGLNGSGKSTLIETIEGLRKIEHGNVQILGMDVSTDFKKIQSSIGIQLQSTSLFGNLTTQETIELYASLYDKTPDVDRRLEEVNLLPEKKKKLIHLSSGQYQRFNLCLALINDPKILFLDEPTTGLDPNVRRMLWDIIKKQAKRNTTIIMSTHYMDEAQDICDKILILHKGKIVAYDTPLNLIRQLDADNVIMVELKDIVEDFKLSALSNSVTIKLVEKGLFIYGKKIETTINILFKWINDNDIQIKNINIRTPNLDDVFIKYTSNFIK